MGEISGGKNVLDFFMEQPEVVPRFNDVILDEEPRFISFRSEPGQGNLCLKFKFQVQT